MEQHNSRSENNIEHDGSSEPRADKLRREKSIE
jgi:hypothetical protein